MRLASAQTRAGVRQDIFERLGDVAEVMGAAVWRTDVQVQGEACARRRCGIACLLDLAYHAAPVLAPFLAE